MSEAREQLAELMRAGAHRYDPVRFRYLESLTQRLADSAHRTHGDQLRQALDHFQTLFFTERKSATALVEQLIERYHANREDLQHHLDRGDFKAIRHLATRHQQPPSPLAQLLLALRTNDDARDERPDATDPLATLLREQHARLRRLGGEPIAAPPRELKAARHLRATQARRHTEHRIQQAITETPDDAGPLNAHRLVTRTIERMRTISPAYVNRLAGYMEVLMVLEKTIGKT